MKKRLYIFLICSAVALSACGQSDKTESTSQSVATDTSFAESAESFSDFAEEMPSSESLVDYKIADTSVKLWEGSEEEYEDGIFSFANNITIEMHENATEKTPEEAIRELVLEDIENKLAYTNYSIKSISANDTEASAVVQYEDNGTNGESILYVNSNVSGEVSYYTDVKDDMYKEYVADTKYIEMVKDAYLVKGKEIEATYNVDEMRPIEEVDVKNSNGDTVTQIFAWNPEFDILPSDDSVSSVEENIEDLYVNGFTSGMRGIYISGQVYKGTSNAKNEINAYLENIRYFAPDDTKYSDIVGDEKEAYVVIHHDVNEDGTYGLVICKVVVEDNCYKNIVIEMNPGANRDYFEEAAQAYHVKDEEVIHQIEPITYSDEEYMPTYSDIELPEGMSFPEEAADE